MYVFERERETDRQTETETERQTEIINKKNLKGSKAQSANLATGLT